MNKYLIIIAGPPATGKTYLVSLLQENLDRMTELSPDEFKIDLADNYGFRNKQEKDQQEKQAWNLFYESIDLNMRAQKKFIVIEYPFSDKQKDKLKMLSANYNYRNITIRLTADFEVLWKRRKIRDVDSKRHLSLISNSYQYGDVLEDRTEASALITREEFLNIIEERSYNTFRLGELFEFDVTDFDKVDYTILLKYLRSL